MKHQYRLLLTIYNKMQDEQKIIDTTHKDFISAAFYSSTFDNNNFEIIECKISKFIEVNK